MKLQLDQFGGLAGRERQVFLFVGPAGAGKNRIWERLCDLTPGLGVPVSTTTRAPRTRQVHEVNGVHYHFVDEAEFQRRLAAGMMLEHSVNHGNYYGLQQDALDLVFSAGKDAICDLSIDGAINLKKALPGQVVVIFVLPSEFADLRKRMLRRGTDDPEELATRLRTATNEIERIVHAKVADYLIINDDDLGHVAIREALGIIEAERHRFSLQQFNPDKYLPQG